MREIAGGCHCGNIRYRLFWPLDGPSISARACGCSFCRPRDATYTSHAKARLEVAVEDEGLLSRYRFGTATADFFVCGRCGAVPCAISEIDGRDRAVVNVRTIDASENLEFEVSPTDFDGESTTERLGRRARNWIPDVRFVPFRRDRA